MQRHPSAPREVLAAARLASQEAVRCGHAWDLCKQPSWKAAKTVTAATAEGDAGNDGKEGRDSRQWTVSSRYCEACNSLGSFFARRSHCRVCGRNVCRACVTDADPCWLSAPYIELCRGIPEGYASRMRTCHACFVDCCNREQTWIWSRVLVDLMPFGVHATAWGLIATTCRDTARRQQLRLHKHEVPQTTETTESSPLARCAAAMTFRVLLLTHPDSQQVASASSPASLLDTAIVAADCATAHVFDAVHSTAKFASMSESQQACFLQGLPLHLVLTVLHVPQSVRTVTSCCKTTIAGSSQSHVSNHTLPPSTEFCPAPSHANNFCDTSSLSVRNAARIAARNSRGVTGGACGVSGDGDSARLSVGFVLPLCCPANQRTVMACMTNQQRLAAACVHGSVAIDALALVDEPCAARVRLQVRALCDTLQVLRGQRCLGFQCGSSASSVYVPFCSRATKIPPTDASRIFVGGIARRMTAVRWLDETARVADVRCSPSAQLLVWLDCVDHRLVAASAFASPTMYRSAFVSTISNVSGASPLGASPLGAAMMEDAGLFALKACLVITVHASGSNDSAATAAAPPAPPFDCGNNAAKMRRATLKSMFVQSLVLTALQLCTGRHIDRANAKFLVDGAGILLCYHAPLLLRGCEPHVACPHGTVPDTALSLEQQATVRTACADLVCSNPEFLFWLGALLTGTRRAVSKVARDSPLIYLV